MALAAFLDAASKRGAYAEQASTGEVAVSEVVRKSMHDPEGGAEDLHTLHNTLTRLVVNSSCRLSQRHPSIRPLRDALAALCSRVNAQLKDLGVAHGQPSHLQQPKGLRAMSAADCPYRHQGPRHLCAHGCYFREHEPHRLLHTFLLAATALGHRRERLIDWRGAAAAVVSCSACVEDDAEMVEVHRHDRLEEGSNVNDDGREIGTRKRQRRRPPSKARPLRSPRRPAHAATTSATATACLVSPSGDIHGSVSEALRSLGETPAGGKAAGTVVSGSGSPPSPGKARRSTTHLGLAAPSRFGVTSRYFCTKGAVVVGGDSRGGDSSEGSSSSGTCESAGAAHKQNASEPQLLARVPALANTRPWRPPHSPYGLLEELLWDRPWALLLCCILFNQTSRVQVDPVLARLLDAFPDAASLAAADAEALEDILRPLGLHRRRARTLVAFSAEFLKGEWRKAEELPGIGRYAADAHAIFCEGRWRETEAQDHALSWYVDWIRTTEPDAEGVAVL